MKSSSARTRSRARGTPAADSGFFVTPFVAVVCSKRSVIPRTTSREMSVSTGSSAPDASAFSAGIQAGMVMVNAPTAGVDYHVPFGGTKGSSMGPREQGFAASEFYARSKTVYVAP